jgi:hypothetical protein
MEKINTRRAIAALIHGFFEAYTAGIIDSNSAGESFKQLNNPSNVKQLMLNHYEEIFKHFYQVMFYGISLITYSTAEEMQEKLEKSVTADTKDIDMLRFACRHDELYDEMVDEYKLNFSALLEGKITLVKDFLSGHHFPDDNISADSDRVIITMVRTVLRAYANGITSSKTGKQSLNQATVYRLLINNFTILLHNGDVVKHCDELTLYSIFLKVCKNKHNCDLMFSELDNVYKELMEEDGISSDDKLN